LLLAQVPLRPDSSPLDRPDYITPLAEELRIPGASQLYFLANRDCPNIPDCHIKAYAIKRDVKKINLNIIAVTYRHQNLAFLLLSLRQTTIKVCMGNLAAFMTANGPSSDLIGD
jgi:hypothetical protein